MLANFKKSKRFCNKKVFSVNIGSPASPEQSFGETIEEKHQMEESSTDVSTVSHYLFIHYFLHSGVCPLPKLTYLAQ
jgi:hypothetical protein